MSGDEEEAFEAGRTVVRDLLVNRLTTAGLRPRKGVSPAAHAKTMDHLVTWLAYMAPDNVTTLAESILTHAAKTGPDMGLWPSELLIRNWAEAMQPKPFRLHPIVASWLRSREGPTAQAGGYLVELLRWLKRHKRPVGTYDMIAIKEAAADEQRRIAAIRDRIEADRAAAGDHEALAAWQRDWAEALQYVDEGNAGRAAKAAATDGNGVAA